MSYTQNAPLANLAQALILRDHQALNPKPLLTPFSAVAPSRAAAAAATPRPRAVSAVTLDTILEEETEDECQNTAASAAIDPNYSAIFASVSCFLDIKRHVSSLLSHRSCKCA